MTVSARCFPPSWTVEDIGATFAVKDNAGQKLAYVYYEEEPGRRAARQHSLVSANASDTDPASLLAVFVADDGAQLTQPAH